MMTDEAMTMLATYFIEHEIDTSGESLPDSFRDVAIEGIKEYWRQNPLVFEQQWAEFLEMNIPKKRITFG